MTQLVLFADESSLSDKASVEATSSFASGFSSGSSIRKTPGPGALSIPIPTAAAAAPTNPLPPSAPHQLGTVVGPAFSSFDWIPSFNRTLAETKVELVFGIALKFNQDNFEWNVHSEKKVNKFKTGP